MKEQIISRTLALFGGSNTSAPRQLQEICEACAESLAARLRDGITPENIREPFVTAASYYSAAALLGMGQDVEEFKVGDMTVRNRDISRRQKDLYRQADVLIAPYLLDNFLFMGV